VHNDLNGAHRLLADNKARGMGCVPSFCPSCFTGIGAGKQRVHRLSRNTGLFLFAISGKPPTGLNNVGGFCVYKLYVDVLSIVNQIKM
jgi:hypothetical protein